MSEQPQGAGTPKPEGEPTNSGTVLAGGPSAVQEPVKPEGSPAATVVPKEYDLKLPEGSLLDASHLEITKSYAKERGLSQDDAQKLLERENAVVASFVDGQRQKLEIEKDKWADVSRNDKEFGGEKFKQSVELAHRVIASHGSQALKEALNSTGLGNHPELIRLLVRIGKSMANDSFVNAGSPPAIAKSDAEVIYPNHTK